MWIQLTNVVGFQAIAIAGSEPWRGGMEWPGVLTPGLRANQISKPWRGDRDAGVLENVATCVTPPGFRLLVGTHHWGLHPRLLHATPPAFRAAPAAGMQVGMGYR